MLRWSSWVALVALGACTKREPAKPVTTETQPAPAVSAEVPRSAPVDTAPPAAWTDPRIVAALAADCDYAPAAPAADGPNVPADLFHCAPGHEQACAYDPCDADEDDCKEGCGRTCQSCGSGCSTACKACKTKCTDDTCKQACAASCAACKQDCTRTMDRCTSGGCTEKAIACQKRVNALYETNGCEKVCSQNDDCVRACASGVADPEASRRCTDACFAKLDARVNACLGACRGKSCYHDCFFTSGCSRDMCNVGSMVRTP